MPRGIGRRRRWSAAWLYGVLAGLGVAGLALAFRQGLVPPLLNPLPPIDLAEARPWLADWRLAAIKRHASVCARTLKAPQIEALQIADGPVHDGCGWSNAVRLTSAGGVHAAFDRLTCETAVALALWLEHEVQPLAAEVFGQRVAAVRSLGSYACRNIRGSPLWRHRRSEHATANAVDIAGFTLADGRRRKRPPSLEKRGRGGPLPARGPRPRLPLLPRRAGPRLQRRPPRPFPPGPRPVLALPVTRGGVPPLTRHRQPCHRCAFALLQTPCCCGSHSPS